MPSTKEQIERMMRLADWAYDRRDCTKAERDAGRQQQRVLRGALREMAVTDPDGARRLWLDNAPADWPLPEFLEPQMDQEMDYFKR